MEGLLSTGPTPSSFKTLYLSKTETKKTAFRKTLNSLNQPEYMVRFAGQLLALAEGFGLQLWLYWLLDKNVNRFFLIFRQFFFFLRSLTWALQSTLFQNLGETAYVCRVLSVRLGKNIFLWTLKFWEFRFGRKKRLKYNKF